MGADARSNANPPLVDPFGRGIEYLRVSVTDRCDFRCVYCMSEHMTFLPKKDLLTLEELDRLCSAFVAQGVRKLRITGGEPLVRKNIMWLFRALARHLQTGALEELTLTTNGSQLAKYAHELEGRGRRTHQCLDRYARCRQVPGHHPLGRSRRRARGLDAAQKAGLKVKINAVALKGVNEDEIEDLMRFAHGRGADLTLIETMPLGDIDGDRTDQYLPLSIVRARLMDRFTLEDIALSHRRPGALRHREGNRRAARLHHAADAQFLRKLQSRAAHLHGHALYVPGPGRRRRPARAAARLQRRCAAARRHREAISRKPKGHDFIIDRQTRKPAVARHMSVTGG